MNKEKMLKLASCIENVPEKGFNMGSWASKDLVSQDDLENACGTTCCIAGWQQAFRGRTINIIGNVFERGKFVGEAPDLCGRDLELTRDERRVLFHREDWPTEAGGRDFPNTPKDAADRIRYMVETGK
jgi:hypothetical protein